MKIAVSGKGGSGKTTVAALLCRALVERRYRVLALDADPDANLALALGAATGPVPLSERRGLIEARTGARAGNAGWFALSPFVDDLPEELSIEVSGLRLLAVGGVARGGGGCACPEAALVRALLSHLLLARDEALVVDLEAGLEPLGRGTARGVEHLLVVAEPGQRAVACARQVARLAGELGIPRCWLLANKIDSATDLDFLREALPELPVLGALPQEPRFVAADRLGAPVWEAAPERLAEIDAMLGRLG